MSLLMTIAALGSLYFVISLCFIFHFSLLRFINVALIAYIALAAHLIGTWAGDSPSLAIFVVAIVASSVVVAAISFCVDTFLIAPLSHMSISSRVIVSTSVLFFIITLITVIWPSGTKLESPWGTDGITLLGSDVAYIDVVSVVVAIMLALGFGCVLKKTAIGHRVRSYADDASTARAYGVSTTLVYLAMSIMVGVTCSVAGALLASPGSPRAGVTSTLFFALIAMSVVIIARTNIKLALISSAVIAAAQIYAARYLHFLNDWANNIASVFIHDPSIRLGPTFADRFVPFAVALIAVVMLPRLRTGADND